jgi:glycosyltransferase involved in cell wall biosynthesis
MKSILFCTPAKLSKSLGHAKVIVELAEEMQQFGWECDFLCPWDFTDKDSLDPIRSFSPNLKAYLKDRAGDYDVVDCDHCYLPYARSEFSPKTLMVARSVLLAHHLETILIPKSKGIKAALGRMLKGAAQQRKQQELVQRAHATVNHADLVNVSNEEDKAELMRRGIAENKLVVLPYGISQTRRSLFDQISSAVPPHPMVAFVGTFDYRKGAYEFPKIVSQIVASVPNVNFKLLGTKGMFQTEAEVRAHFPQRLQKYLEIISTYKPEELPSLLASCSIGIFPSHLEGFGFGVLEMLAASLPVIAYDAPGPPMMLPPKYLVPRGDWKSISDKVIALLRNKHDLAEARCWAKQRSQDFAWKGIAKTTSEIYQQAILDRKSPN